MIIGKTGYVKVRKVTACRSRNLEVQDLISVAWSTKKAWLSKDTWELREEHPICSYWCPHTCLQLLPEINGFSISSSFQISPWASHSTRILFVRGSGKCRFQLLSPLPYQGELRRTEIVLSFYRRLFSGKIRSNRIKNIPCASKVHRAPVCIVLSPVLGCLAWKNFVQKRKVRN